MIFYRDGELKSLIGDLQKEQLLAIEQYKNSDEPYDEEVFEEKCHRHFDKIATINFAEYGFLAAECNICKKQALFPEESIFNLYTNHFFHITCLKENRILGYKTARFETVVRTYIMR